MNDIGTFDLDGITLRLEPARDDCFTVVRTDTEMEERDGFGDHARREMVHRHMSNEVTSIDIAAQCIVDFPDAPWPLRMELARQCYDETRHVRALHRRLVEMGGFKGEFPISAFEWCVTSALDSLPARLAEGELKQSAMQFWSLTEQGALAFRAGQFEESASLFEQSLQADTMPGRAVVNWLDAILADEVQHVRFANRWIKKMAAENPRVLMKVAQAIRFLAEANARLVAQQGAKSAAGKEFAAPEERVPAVNVEDRKLAEFTDDEVQVILRQAGFRTIA